MRELNPARVADDREWIESHTEEDSMISASPLPWSVLICSLPQPRVHLFRRGTQTRSVGPPRLPGARRRARRRTHKSLPAEHLPRGLAWGAFRLPSQRMRDGAQEL